MKANPSLPARTNPPEASAGLIPKQAETVLQGPCGIRILPGTSNWPFEQGSSLLLVHGACKRQAETSLACFPVLPGCVSGNRIVTITSLTASGKEGRI